MSKLLLLFYATTTNFTLKFIDTYGTTPLSSVYDVRVQSKPNYRIYLIDNGNDVILQYTQDLKFLKSVSIAAPKARSAELIDDIGLYVPKYDNNDNSIMFYENNLNLKNLSYLSNATYVSRQSQIRYWPFNSMLYVPDANTNYLNAFNLSFARIPTESFYVNYTDPPQVVTFLQTGSHQYIFVGLTSSRILTLSQNMKIYVGLSLPLCTNPGFGDIYYTSVAGLVVSCINDGLVKLFIGSGNTGFTQIGSNITIQSKPAGMVFDSFGRFFVAALNKIYVFVPNDYPF